MVPVEILMVIVGGQTNGRSVMVGRDIGDGTEERDL